MQAKYYLYRNLHTGTFSVKFKGRVVAHPSSCILEEVEFCVSIKGRQRVLKEKRKNVHATVAAKCVKKMSDDFILDDYEQIYYNPYTTDRFIDEDGTPVYRADRVICTNNKIYLKRIINE